MDDRVCMHYVLDRLEGIVETYKTKDVTEAIQQIEEFKQECIYNLGVNQRLKNREPRPDVKCPECDGDGYVEMDVPRPHNFNRDVGYLDVERVTCETCHGDGTVQDDDD